MYFEHFLAQPCNICFPTPLQWKVPKIYKIEKVAKISLVCQYSFTVQCAASPHRGRAERHLLHVQ